MGLDSLDSSVSHNNSKMHMKAACASAANLCRERKDAVQAWNGVLSRLK